MQEFEEAFRQSLKYGQKILSIEHNDSVSTYENHKRVIHEKKVKIANPDDREETIYCVAKTYWPVYDLWEMFKNNVSFEREIAAYTTIFPALNEFGKEKGVDCIIDFIPKYLGSRVTMNPRSVRIDKDAVIVLENLKVEGYDVSDRFIGFDLACAELLLQNLAVLHAVSIVYKLEEPEKFTSEVCGRLKTGCKFYTGDGDDFEDVLLEQIKTTLSKDSKCIPYLSKLDEGVLSFKNAIKNPPKVNKLFGTLIHNDYWVNNILLQLHKGTPAKAKMVDFQYIEYNSLVKDVIYFLYSSVELSILEHHLDELIVYYYQKFLGTLVRLKCNTILYTYQAYMEEFAHVAKEQEFGHLLFALVPMLMYKDKLNDMIIFQRTVGEIFTEGDCLDEVYFRRLQFMLLDFVKRGWI